MNPYVLLGIGVAVALAFGGVAKVSYDAGYDAHEASAAREERLIRAAGDAAAEKAAGAISRIQVKNETIRQEVQREVIERPVYRECRHSPDGLRNINSALTGVEPPTGGGELPLAGATK